MIQEFQKNFNILDARKLIKKAWDKVAIKNIGRVWKNLCFELIDYFEGYDNLYEGLQKRS